MGPEGIRNWCLRPLWFGHRFVYDRDTRQFSEIKYGRTVGQYTFEEFDQLVKDRGMVSGFSPYEFRIEKE